MLDKNIPFHAQAALLDRYIHAKDLSFDPEMVSIIVEILHSNNSLRQYFFRSGPSVAWAEILWKNDFFNSPPEPIRTEQGLTLPPWDAQYYLISIADQVPDIVISHIKKLDTHGWYHSRAIEALCKIPPLNSEEVLSIIVNWLKDQTKHDLLLDQCTYWMDSLVKGSRWEAAIVLFAEISKPLVDEKQNRNVFSGPNIYHHKLFGTKDEIAFGFNVLKKEFPERIIEILEKNLLSRSTFFSQWWRNTIEDSGQDYLETYEDLMLCALRDTLLPFVKINVNRGREIIKRYLNSSIIIIRRLGFYLIWSSGKLFSDLASEELLKPHNIDDTKIYHEYFMLLEHNFKFLQDLDKEKVIGLILQGPDPNRIKELADWMEKESQIDKDKFIVQRNKAWIRDRLWMIQEDLNKKDKKHLASLVEELGSPEHPSYLSWMGEGFSVSDISPFPEEQLAELSSDEIYKLIREWVPNPKDEFGPEIITYWGLANVIANLILKNYKKYLPRLNEIVLLRPEYLMAIINHWTNKNFEGKIPWHIALDLCKQVLGNPRLEKTEQHDFNNHSWLGSRIAVTSLFEIGLISAKQRIPKYLLPKLKRQIFLLIKDPDPTPDEDGLDNTETGNKDYINASLNHVRPRATRLLIDYALYKSRINKAENKKIYLERDVKEILTKEVNDDIEKSLIVHSVYGEKLPILYWLDKKWVEENLDHIFPSDPKHEKVRLFLSAWDSYVALNRYNHKLFDLLRSRYQEAVVYISKGYTTKSHLDVIGHFAIQLVANYLLTSAEKGIDFDKDSLLVEFASKVEPENRSRIGWALWIVCKDNPKDLSVFWPKAKSFWEWRTNEATMNLHSPDFRIEMEEYSHLLSVAPNSETISSLRHLLDSLLNYIQGPETSTQLWRNVEEFLAKQVMRDPINTIRYYRSMYEMKKNRPLWFFHSDAAKKIIEVSAHDEKSRADALSLIDLLASWGDTHFSDIYRYYSSK